MASATDIIGHLFYFICPSCLARMRSDVQTQLFRTLKAIISNVKKIKTNLFSFDNLQLITGFH